MKEHKQEPAKVELPVDSPEKVASSVDSEKPSSDSEISDDQDCSSVLLEINNYISSG